MKCPAEVYQPSSRPYTGLPDLDYPFHDKTIVVTRCGRICLGNKKINFSLNRRRQPFQGFSQGYLLILLTLAQKPAPILSFLLEPKWSQVAKI